MVVGWRKSLQSRRLRRRRSGVEQSRGDRRVQEVAASASTHGALTRCERRLFLLHRMARMNSFDLRARLRRAVSAGGIVILACACNDPPQTATSLSPPEPVAEAAAEPTAANDPDATPDSSVADAAPHANAADAGAAADASQEASTGSAARCRQGATCGGENQCAASDGTTSYACDCDATGHFTCGDSAVASLCPPDPSTVGHQCSTMSGPKPKVLCTSNNGGCQVVACKARSGSSTLGWGGSCEFVPACAPAGTALCGSMCVPGATGCTCAQGALNPTPVPCACVPVGVGLGGFWSC